MTAYLRDLNHRCLTTFWELARIMIPIMILMRVAETYGLIDAISPALHPVMALVNLPPETAIIFVTSVLTGIYGALAALPILLEHDLTAAQVTSICTFILIAHAIPLEQSIVRRAGGPFWGTSFMRVFAGLLSCLLIDQLSRWTGLLSHTQSMDHIRQFAQSDAGHLEWALASAKGMIVVFIILVVLLIGMDLLDRFGITDAVNRLLAPLLRLAGLDKSVATITTAGILLGLAYGGGLIIAKGNDPAITQRSRVYALYWLSLCHGLIEDVAIMVAVGGNFWVLFFGRIVLTLVLIHALMAWHRYRPPVWMRPA